MDSRPSSKIGSSPPRPASSPASASDHVDHVMPDHVGGSRSRKPPSVTPRTFRRFFTPRSSLVQSREVSAARDVLRDITSPALNRRANRPHGLSALGPFRDVNAAGDENATALEVVTGKRRKVLRSPEPWSNASTPSKRRRTSPPPIVVAEDADEASTTAAATSLPASQEEVHDFARPLRRRTLVRFSEASVGARVLKRSMGELGAGLRAMHCASLREETGNFFSQASDVHLCSSVGRSERIPPFCTATCNTNTLVAVGDEKGGVRLLESARDGTPNMRDAYLHFQPHDNAILDLTFSSDDMLLATASGDQTARIIDMPTRRVVSTLAGHVSSVKQVHFQPGQSANNILATSSRDGSVHVWDLRCRGSDGPVQRLHVPLEPADHAPTAKKTAWARPVNSILDAHPERRPPSTTSKTAHAGIDAASSTRSESPGSVTALSFLPTGREHLLLTASEGNACIKLWDLRTTHTHRRGRAVPLSTTRQPESHDRYRHFGINALALSGDGGRLYSLCRDNTIYAYSTNHLVLGHAPGLSLSTCRPRRSGGTGKDGLGPIYGMRHPLLHTATFYVKMSLRRARGDKSEVLAVGSSDGCAVLFPTDERQLAPRRPDAAGARVPGPSPRPGLPRSSSGAGLSGRLHDTVPIHQPGTALVRGHQREVTGVSWTAEGELITASDDFLVRCWREGGEARDLRRGGESDGRRWGCGWAEASNDNDDE